MQESGTAARTIEVMVDERGVATVLLNRPAARNALDADMVGQMTSRLAELAARADVRGLVLHGAGKHFCAGMDLGWMAAGIGQPAARLRQESLAIQSLYRAVHEFPRPTAAVVQGAAVAGGLGLACACDIVLATEDAVFAASEVRIGLIPGMLLPLLVRRLGAGAARTVGALGMTYGAAEMRSMGLVARMAPSLAELEPLWREIREAMLATSPDAVADFKRTFDRIDWGRAEGVYATCLDAMVASRLSEPAQAGLGAVLRREPPPWAGAPAQR